MVNRGLLFGIGDAMVSSAATFLVGIYATRVLPLEDLGAYGFFFAGSVVLVTGFMGQLYFVPAEIALADRPSAEQVRSLRVTTLRGLPITFGISVIVTVLCAAILQFDTDPLLVVGAIGTGTVWPLQDHVRRLLHQVSRSGMALIISVMQFVTMGLVLTVGAMTDRSPAALPFAALFVANAVSTVVGIMLAQDGLPKMELHVPDTRAVTKVGGWLVVAGQAEQLSAFVALSILSWVAGRTALGEYEAARLLAQPVIVFSFGLQNFLRGPAMAAVRQGNRPEGHRASKQYFLLLFGAAMLLALAGGIPWPGNPLVTLFPAAYELKGMVVLTVLAAAIMQSKGIYGLMALAAGRERDLARITVPNAPIMPIVVAVLAWPLGAFALPLGTVADRLVWQFRFRPMFSQLFRPGPQPTSARLL